MTDDSDQPATKADITAVKADITAVKADMSLLATKTELQAVRSELKEDIKRVAVEVVKMQGQIQQMEERINARMDTRFDQILSAIDAFAKKSENYDKAALHGPILTEVQVGLKDQRVGSRSSNQAAIRVSRSGRASP